MTIHTAPYDKNQYLLCRKSDAAKPWPGSMRDLKKEFKPEENSLHQNALKLTSYDAFDLRKIEITKGGMEKPVGNNQFSEHARESGG